MGVIGQIWVSLGRYGCHQVDTGVSGYIFLIDCIHTVQQKGEKLKEHKISVEEQKKKSEEKRKAKEKLLEAKHAQKL